MRNQLIIPLVLALPAMLLSCRPVGTGQQTPPPRAEATMRTQSSLTPAPLSSPTPLPAPTVSPTPTPDNRPNPRDSIVGAIRWDAWVGELPTFGDATSQNRVGVVVERNLSPNKVHYRLPFYAVELEEDLVQIRGTSQDIMDQEIAYAKKAGLDYWAFVYYPAGSGLDTARDLYLSSQSRSEIHFSLIFDNPGYLKDALESGLLIDYFRLPEYQTVIGNRPLFYVLNFTGLSQADDLAIRETVINIRAKALEAGRGNPYIVYMGSASNSVKLYVETYGLDAGSAYAEFGSGGMTYPKLARMAEMRWDSFRQRGLKVIPWVTAGWDPRPRIENPVPWGTYDPNGWAEPGTPEEIAQHLQKALLWNAAYPDVGEANTVLIYAWNEFDEGGWICPTLYGGTDRLDAIAKLLVGKP